MWNNGNGSGQGNDDVYGRLNNTREIGGVRFPFIEPGKHRFAVVTLEEFEGQRQGDVKVRILLRTMESTKHKVGDLVVRILGICEPPAFQNGISDGELFADFVRKLKGAPAGAPMAESLRTLMKHRVLDQLARGIQIDCLGVPNRKGNWVNLYWTHVEGQTPEQITQLRAQIEAEGVPPTGGTSQRGSGRASPQANSYAQPQYPTPGPSSAPPVSPAGGFLSQIPPQGSGNQGNGGQGAW